MKAIVHDDYGPPDGLELRELDRPTVDGHGVLVRVRAASVNPVDWHLMRGEPYLVRLTDGFRRPKRPVPGVDLAGHVEVVGENVKNFQPGDEVLGTRGGSFAEYVAVPEDNLVAKPAGLAFEQAAAIPVAGCTALEALRDRGRLQLGQRVLINGAAGGVGTFAVQLAKAFGGQVTGVCSTRNVEMVRSIGADHVVDYTVEDFTRSGQRYDLMLHVAGNRSLSDLRRAITPKGTLVLVGAGTGRQEGGGGLLGPGALALAALVESRFVGQRLIPFLAKVRNDDLVALKELVEAGKVMPVVGRTYPLSEAPEAIRYLESGHARGKTVITV
jgi:NADPH:quinone reductase-like Zn-dependent oxidoreductase